LLRIRIMCSCGATCLSADCCFSDIALYKNPTKHVGLVQKGPHHVIKCKLFSPWYSNKIAYFGVKQSLTQLHINISIHIFYLHKSQNCKAASKAHFTYIFDRLRSVSGCKLSSTPQIGILLHHYLKSLSDLKVFSNRCPF
jgi:hypothetical protein